VAASGNFYRPDIDGLRAVSVLSVFLYHLDVPIFTGGFVGVDIFFVISGYLISRNVLDDVDKGRFSIQRFYERRIRRLFPAAIVTIIGTMAVGALWFAPEQFKGLAQDVVATLGSVSNFYFWRGSHSYFARSTDPSAVLHFWSLAVEEQFYLVWPAVILVGRRWLPSCALPALILFIAVCSLAAAQSMLAIDPSRAFYLPMYRGYEFAIGALVIFVEPRFALRIGVRTLLAALGFCLIAYSVFEFDGTTAFPGVNALVPCVGACCLIWAGPSHHLSRALTNPVAVRTGLISYSLYLVHWPLIVFATYVLGEMANFALVKAAFFVAAIVLAELMYRFVEIPFRSRRSSIFRVAWPAAAISVAVAAVAFAANRQDGWPWRLTVANREVAELQKFGFTPCAKSPQSKCGFGSLDAPVGVQLLGDSFAEQYVAAFDPVAKDLNVRGEAYTAEGCPMLVGLIRTNFEGTEKCRSERDKLLSVLQSNNAPIVISQSWLTYGNELHSDFDVGTDDQSFVAVWRTGIENTIRDLGAGGRQFLIMGAGVEPMCGGQTSKFAPGPLWHAPSKPCPAVSLESVRSKNRDFNAMLRVVRERHHDQVYVVFPEEYLCETNCSMILNGLWLYWGIDHLTVAGAQRVGKMADSILRSFIQAGNRREGDH
jgi:peptidoglycan/LPS O-acetylase OafA/YrhL